jgi:uracil-DNA glycosylase
MPRRPKFPGAQEFLPEVRTLETLREAAQGCRGCDLYQHATQAVFGAGGAGRRVMFIGEQPGNEEDKAGEPFVGPAGRLLDKSLEAAGIAREDVYVTNVVKHFKFEPRGKRRIHQKPTTSEIGACLPWLEEELRLVQPRVLIALGATAAQAILGKEFKLTEHRGELVTSKWARHVMAIPHPSSILRIPEDEDRRKARALLVEDLKRVAEVIEARELLHPRG